MANEIVRPSELPPRASPVASELIPSDNGSVVGGVTWAAGVNAGRPLANQSEAEAGANASKAMTPLTTKQAIGAQVPALISAAVNDLNLGTAAQQPVEAFATAAQGVKADSAVQPTRQIIAGTGTTGGGDLSADRTISLSTGSIESLGKADTALQRATFREVADLIDDDNVEIGYVGSGAVFEVIAGDIIEADGFRYEVAESDATDYHVETDGGVKVYVAPVDDIYDVRAFGARGDGSDDSAPVQKALTAGKAVRIPYGMVFDVVGLTITQDGRSLVGPGTLRKRENVDGILLEIFADSCEVSGVTFDGSQPQPNTYWINNILRCHGDDNKIINNTINGSYGGGITLNVGASRNVVAFNKIMNVYDNSIMVGGANTNDNLILGNHCDGTVRQNNIFVTASPASTPTEDECFRNRVIGNTCLNSGDTNIESGIQTRGTIIADNYCENSVNPGILLRDAAHIVVDGNIVKAGPGAGSNYDGISLLNQVGAEDEYLSVISNNHVYGNLRRAGISLQQALHVLVEGNLIEGNRDGVDMSTGAGLIGAGIRAVSTTVDVSIQGNKVTYVADGIRIGETSTPVSEITVADNTIQYVGGGIAMRGGVQISNSKFVDNQISAVATAAYRWSGSSGGRSTVIARNHISLPGFSSASPAFADASYTANLGYLTDETIRAATVPETQYGFLTLKAASQVTAGYVVIDFEDGSESLIAAFIRGSTTKIAGTAGMLDSSGSSGFSGWSLFYNGSNNLILQRRGSSTGAAARFLRHRVISLADL